MTARIRQNLPNLALGYWESRTFDLNDYVIGATGAIGVTFAASQPWLVPSSAGLTYTPPRPGAPRGPAQSHEFGFRIDTGNANRPPGDWQAKNTAVFSAHITEITGQGERSVGTLSSTVTLVLAPDVRVARPIPDITIPQNSVDYFVSHLRNVFDTDSPISTSRARATTHYQVRFASSGFTARVDPAGDRLRVSTTNIAQGTVTVRCLNRSALNGPRTSGNAQILSEAEDTFRIDASAVVTPTVQPGGLPPVYMWENEERSFDLTGHYANAEGIAVSGDIEVTYAGQGIGETFTAHASGDQVVMQAGPMRRTATASPDRTVSRQYDKVQLAFDVAADPDDTPLGRQTLDVHVLARNISIRINDITAMDTGLTLELDAPNAHVTQSAQYGGYPSDWRTAYQFEARDNLDTSILLQTESLPASLTLPHGGRWTMRGQAFLTDGIGGYTRGAPAQGSGICPELAQGDVNFATDANDIVLTFDYEQLTGADYTPIDASQVTDVHVHAAGDATYDGAPQPTLEGSDVVVRVRPSAPDGAAVHSDYKVRVTAKVAGLPVDTEADVRFGSSTTAAPDGTHPRVLVDGQDLTSEVVGLEYDSGRQDVGGLLHLASAQGTVTLQSLRDVENFTNGRIELFLGQRIIMTGFVFDYSKDFQPPQSIRLEFKGVYALAGQRLINHAGPGGAQSDVLREVCLRVGIPFTSSAGGEQVPPHKAIGSAQDVLAAIEAYGGVLLETPNGGLRFGPIGAAPYNFVIGQAGPGEVGITDYIPTDRRRTGRYNNADMPQQFMDTRIADVVIDTPDGDLPGRAFDLILGIDPTTYYAGASTHTLTRQGTRVTAEPFGSPAFRYDAKRHLDYDGIGRLTLQRTRGLNEPVRSLPEQYAPNYSYSAVEQLLQVGRTLDVAARESLALVSIDAPFGSREIDAVSRVRPGMTVAVESGSGLIEREACQLNFRGGLIHHHYFVNGDVGGRTPGVEDIYLDYDQNEDWDSGRLWY